MNKNRSYSFLGVVIVLMVSASSWADTQSSFECREYLTVDSGEDYLRELGNSIQNQAESELLSSNPKEMQIFLEKLLCYQRHQGDILIFEWLLPFENTNIFKESLKKIDVKRQETITQALINLKGDFSD
ncbi:MAG: hypothetical protein RJB66_949 [Pseudomonadota bacterium]|jgi:hypothetical protein